MVIERLSICGLRGFSVEEHITFACPSGEPGSGVTVLIGPNGGGKSTVLEALRDAGRKDQPSFAQGKRNVQAGDQVRIEWTQDGQTASLSSVRQSSSETHRNPVAASINDLLHLPSRRSFNPYFARHESTRMQYATGTSPGYRAQTLDHFSQRLVAVERGHQRELFDDLVERIAGVRLNWSIDQQDSGQHFVKVRTGIATHSSDGLGEGTISLLFLADALYDSSPGEAIVIDEPELSLHPIHQRRLRSVLSEYAATRQIILATHSPYFVDWSDIGRGGSICRIHSTDGRIQISIPSRDTLDRLVALTLDLNNPHVLGLNASEVFFLEDGVILVEGQEDVLVYQAMAEELGIRISGTFFGWGVGGAEKMPIVVQLLKELGFRRVVGILDGNRIEAAQNMREAHPLYQFFVIPAADVRSKEARKPTPEIEGLADSEGRVRPEHRGFVESLFEELNLALLPNET